MNLPNWVYTVLWALWLGLAAGSFAAIETLALLDPDRGDTLTEHLRPVIQSNAVGWVLFGAFVLWLGWHFLIQR